MFYKDINTYTPTQKPDLGDVEAILQSIRNLIFTRPTERLFNVEYGINAEDLLFDLMDNGTSLALLTEITDKIERYEPRVTVDNSATSVDTDFDTNSISINLVFSIDGFDGEIFEVRETLGN